jgi:ceramide glucosyltransferase
MGIYIDRAVIAMAVIAGGYQVFAMIACLIRRRSQESGVRSQNQGVSILKPIRGLDDGLREAIASHAGLISERAPLRARIEGQEPGRAPLRARIEGSEYELLCGVSSLDDPAVAVIREFAREFPNIRVIECRTQTPNAKVGVLMDLAAAARYPILIVNDADIRVDPDYLERVVAPLSDPQVGLVTCLYRSGGSTFAARFEGLGVSTDFAPSALVARLVGVDEFAMGSTMAFRRADLDRITSKTASSTLRGFAAIADYVADDYQLGHRLHGLGLKCVLSDVIVETRLGGEWGDVWAHQVRWARTIRVSKFAGYVGLPVTFATLWAAIAAVCGLWHIALALLAARMLMAIESGWFVMRSRDVLRLWWAIPLRDLFAAAVWCVGLFGNSVIWRGRKLRLDREGRIV